MSNQLSREYTDPSHYAEENKTFESEGYPKTTQGWVLRARRVGEILNKDAPKRDIENKSPRAEISLLKAAGLLKVIGPTKYGGGGESWETGYKCVREVAKGDGSIGMLLGYHLLWSTTANVVGTDEQKEHIQKVIIENNYFVGGAVNPRDNDLKITNTGKGSVMFNGFKNFNTGGVISDLTVLEGVFEDSDAHIFTFVKTDQVGIQFSHNWDNIGLRLTESGSVRIEGVEVPWSDCLGWDAEREAPIQSVLGIPFASLLLPTIQLIFSNFYLGIALGALNSASEYTRTSTRAWPYGGDNKEKAVDEFYILERYGEYRAKLLSAEALADKAGHEVAKVYADADESAPQIGGQVNGASQGSKTRESISADRRGQLAAYVAHVKVVTTDFGLEVTSGIFEMLGSRATAKKYGFDRFWRDVRTHTLHDPVAYKKREVGRYQVLGEIPEPTWYT